MSGPGSIGRPYARRPIRSFVLRGGRLTGGQAKAIEKYWPEFGIDNGAAGGALDFEALFGRRAPVILEIGFGNGDATWRMAQARPDQDFMGVEVHEPGIGRLLMAIAEHGIGNVRIARADAVDYLELRIPRRALAGVRIYFPDPWPKKRHHKRRIVQPPFVELLATRMAPGGVLHLATDWAPYAAHMTEVLGAGDAFRNLAPSGEYCERPEWRPETRYERRGKGLGHRVYDLVYERRP